MSLDALQRWFVSATTDPGGVFGELPPVERDEQVARFVTAGPQLSPLDRLRIYNDGYFARLVECLSDDYPVLGYALGEEGFSSLARAFIEAYPSRSRSLNFYGRPLAAFCRARSEPWAAFASDLGRLEWALVEVIHEPASGVLAPEDLASIPASSWQSARLLPSPALRLLSFDYPVNEFFQAVKDERSPRLPERAHSSTAVYRQGLTLWRRSLEPRAATLLQALLSGEPLAAAVASLEARSLCTDGGEELAQLLPQWLGAWVQSGFFSGVDVG